MTISNANLNVFNQYPNFDIHRPVTEILVSKTFRKSPDSKKDYNRQGDVTDLFGVKSMIYTLLNGNSVYIYDEITGRFLPENERLKKVRSLNNKIMKDMGLTVSLSRRITNFLGTTVNVS